jgi:hypothetical protein
MDENTYRLLTALVTPVVIAIVGAVIAVVATRAEADRAEKRALAHARRDALLSALLETQADLTKAMYAPANELMAPGHNPLREPPLAFNAPLVGDANALEKVIRVATGFASRPKQSGLTKEDLETLSEATEALRRAVETQADLIRAGEEPARIPAAELAPIIRESIERLGDIANR